MCFIKSYHWGEGCGFGRFWCYSPDPRLQYLRTLDQLSQTQLVNLPTWKQIETHSHSKNSCGLDLAQSCLPDLSHEWATATPRSSDCWEEFEPHWPFTIRVTLGSHPFCAGHKETRSSASQVPRPYEVWETLRCNLRHITLIKHLKVILCKLIFNPCKNSWSPMTT